MLKEKFQITLPDGPAKILKDFSKEKGFSKSIIIAMALQLMYDSEQKQKQSKQK